MIAVIWMIVFFCQAEEFLFPNFFRKECLLCSDGLGDGFVVRMRLLIIFIIPMLSLIFANLALMFFIRLKVRRCTPSKFNSDGNQIGRSKHKFIHVTSVSKAAETSSHLTPNQLLNLPLPEVTSSACTMETDVGLSTDSHKPRKMKKTLSVSDILMSRYSRSNDKSNVSITRGTAKDRNLAKTKYKRSSLVLCISLVTVAMVFTLPLTIYLFVTSWFPALHSPMIWKITFFLTFLNPVGNSIVYVLTNRKIRLFYVKLLRKYRT